MPCGLAPLNGVNARFTLLTGNVATPVPSAIAGAGELPRSQLPVAVHPGVVAATPSHCSTNTDEFGVKPDAVTVKACGMPATFPGTTNGFVAGAVMLVAAPALPATTTDALATSASVIAAQRDLRTGYAS